jgi:hypothetical protein
MDDKFWINDPSIFFKNNNYLNFIPSKSSSRIGILNSFSLFSIYVLVIFTLFYKQYIIYPLVSLIFIYILYKIYEKNPKDPKEENLENNKDVVYDDDGNIVKLSTGYYDPDGNLIFRSESPINRDLPCRKPTPDNPFMNPQIHDYNAGQMPAPCNSDDEDVKNEIKGTFNKDLYRDVNDLFDIRNSERQFYTIPAPTIPPDQEKFAQWCFGQNDNCKSDQELCLRQEDLRYKYVRY